MVNTEVLGISIGFIALFISVKFGINNMTGDLERIRIYAISKISERLNETPILKFLEYLESEQNVLLLTPIEKNRPLYISVAVFSIVALVGIFFPLQYTNGLLSNIFQSLYSVAVGTVGYFLWYDFRYYNKFKKLHDKYPVPADYELEKINAITVKCNSVLDST